MTDTKAPFDDQAQYWEMRREYKELEHKFHRLQNLVEVRLGPSGHNVLVELLEIREENAKLLDRLEKLEESNRLLKAAYDALEQADG